MVGGKKHTKAEKVAIVAGAVRDLAREAGLQSLDEDTANALLDEFARNNPTHLATIYYLNLTDREVEKALSNASRFYK